MRTDQLVDRVISKRASRRPHIRSRRTLLVGATVEPLIAVLRRWVQASAPCIGAVVGAGTGLKHRCSVHASVVFQSWREGKAAVKRRDQTKRPATRNRIHCPADAGTKLLSASERDIVVLRDRDLMVWQQAAVPVAASPILGAIVEVIINVVGSVPTLEPLVGVVALDGPTAPVLYRYGRLE